MFIFLKTQQYIESLQEYLSFIKEVGHIWQFLTKDRLEHQNKAYKNVPPTTEAGSWKMEKRKQTQGWIWMLIQLSDEMNSENRLVAIIFVSFNE